MEKLKERRHFAGSILCGLLTAFGIASSIVSLSGGSMNVWFISELCDIVIFCFIAYYAFLGFKKPHGNLLKYIILIYAAELIMSLIPYAGLKNSSFFLILSGVEIGLLCYIAGRLVKVKENLILMILATVCMMTLLILEAATESVNSGIISLLIIWLDICAAYFLRYKEHREAGLSDAPKKS